MEYEFEASSKKKIILNLIRRKQPVSRVELQKITGIRFATITVITKELIKCGIVLEGGIDPRDGKHKKKLLYINNDKYHVIGIDLQPEMIIGILTDLGGNVIDKCETGMTIESDSESIMASILQTAQNIIKKNGRNKTVGVGISCPAALDKERSSIMFSSPIEQLKNLAVKPIVEKKLKIPVYLDSSTNMRLLAEKSAGGAQNTDDVMYVELGKGIAASIVSNGNFVRGYFGLEGELGHTVVDPNGRTCICGNRGCLETIASSEVIVRKIKSMLEQGTYSIVREMADGDISKVDIGMISKAAESGDKIAVNVLDEAGRYIGISIANIVNVVGPQMIIFGGDAASKAGYMIEPIIRAVKANVLANICSGLVFKVSELDNTAGALGAAALAIGNYFIMG